MTKPRKFREYKEILREHLQDDAELAAMYLNEVINNGDKGLILIALRDVLEVRGNIKAFAEKADLPRQSIYRMLSEDGNPTFDKLIAICKAMDLKIQFTPV